MKRIDLIGFATALLAGSALMGLPAVAQDATTSTKPRVTTESGAPTKTERPANDESSSSSTKAAPVETEGSTAGDDGAQASGSTDSGTGTTGADDTSTDQLEKTEEDDTADTDAASEPTTDQQAGDAEDTTTGEEQEEQASEQPSAETTASIDITNEQQVEIRSVIEEADVEPVSVDFDINVGVAVPQTVELRPLPPRIIEVVPEYEGYQYFLLADGRIIIVEPATMEVVYIIVA